MTYHHLYVCREGVTPLRNHLALRDYLRSHPDKVVAYGELKKRLAQQFPHDIDSYISGNTDFILDILEESSFSDNELQWIAHPNRNPSTFWDSPVIGTEFGKPPALSKGSRREVSG